MWTLRRHLARFAARSGQRVGRQTPAGDRDRTVMAGWLALGAIVSYGSGERKMNRRFLMADLTMTVRRERVRPSTPTVHWITVRDDSGRPHLEMRWDVPGATAAAPAARAA